VILVLQLASVVFDHLLTLEFADTFWQWAGIMATIAMCLATAHAILPLRISYYEIFLLTHIALVILALVTCWYHLVPHFGYIYGYQVWLYICFAFWFFDRLARIVRIAYYNRFGNATAIVEALPDCDIMQITIFPRVISRFGPGQHTFLYFPGLGKFWENHPFSVAAWKGQGQPPPIASTPTSLSDSTAKGEKVTEPAAVVSLATGLSPDSTEKTSQAALRHQTHLQDRASITFLIRAHTGMTSTLHRRVLSSPSGSSIETSIYTEGPYAGHRATLQPLFDADTILLLVGGIGITNALGFVQEYTSGHLQRGERPEKSHGIMRKAKRLILAWSAREISLIEHVRSNFLVQQDEVDGIEYSFWCTGSSNAAAQKLDAVDGENHKAEIRTAAVTVGRMDIRRVIRSSVEPGLQTTVLVCGPRGMADEATGEIVSCVKDGLRVDLVEEAFAW